MQDQTPLTPAQRELEQAFRSATPATARLDPLAAAFAAGRLSGRRQLRAWQAGTAAALLLGLTPSLLRLHHSPPTPEQSPATLAAYATPPTAAEPLPAQSLLALQEAIDQRGLNGLPAHAPPQFRTIRADDKL